MLNDLLPNRISITWKITGMVVAVLVVFACSAITIVYQFVGRALHEQIDQRAVAIATSLSDGVAGSVTSGNALLLHAIVTKHALLDGVAYASVQDRNGKVLAHTVAGFAEELKSPTAYRGEGLAGIQKRRVTLRGREVSETVVPIMGGRMGAAQVGLWGDLADEQVSRALMPVVGLVAALLILGIFVAGVLARHIIRPIVQLTSVADAMTHGNLDMPVGIDSRDEIGELAMSLERMRASLKAAMIRFAQENHKRNGANELSGTHEKLASTSL